MLSIRVLLVPRRARAIVPPRSLSSGLSTRRLVTSSMPPKRKSGGLQQAPCRPENLRRSSRRAISASAPASSDEPSAKIPRRDSVENPGYPKLNAPLNGDSRSSRARGRKQIKGDSHEDSKSNVDSLCPDFTQCNVGEGQPSLSTEGGGPEDGEISPEDAIQDGGARRPPPVNSDILPLPWEGRLGYVSLSIICRGSGTRYLHHVDFSHYTAMVRLMIGSRPASTHISEPRILQSSPLERAGSVPSSSTGTRCRIPLSQSTQSKIDPM